MMAKQDTTRMSREDRAAAHVLRTCRRCKITKPLDDFTKEDWGIRSTCKECRAALKRLRAVVNVTQYAEGERACTRCGAVKPFSEFTRTGNGMPGPHCHSCVNTFQRERYHNAPDYYGKRSSRWRKANAQHHVAQTRAYRQANPDRAYIASISLRYGLTIEQYTAMLEEQSGVCAICGNIQTSHRRMRLAVDHDHQSGLVRGLLCDNCNRGIGNFQDNPDRLRKAAEYLEEHQAILDELKEVVNG